MYLADRGQDHCETSRKGSFSTLKDGIVKAFLAWVEHTVLKDR